MRSIFNWQIFKGYLKEDVSSFEYKFMKRVFSQAAIGFAIFGIIVSAIAGIYAIIPGSKFFVPVLGVMALITGIAFMFYYFPKYRSNPLDVTLSFVRRAYISLIFTYGVLFFSILWFSNLVINGFDFQNNGNSKLGWTSIAGGAAFFGITLLVYAIPASIGFFMNKHSKAISLYKFLGFCYAAYLVLFVASLITMFVFLKLNPMINFLLLILCGIIVFSSPILSVYRMKTVTRYLDKSDPVAVKKWEIFFVFEILAQLMQMAVYLIRLSFYLCMICLGRRR